MIKPVLILIALLFCKISFEQTQLSEVNNKEVVKRISFIKKRTDSFLLSKTTHLVFKKFKADFEVTYLSGEFYGNYILLNKQRDMSPEDIYQINQYYELKDSNIHLTASVGIYYYDPYQLETRFSSISDSLTLQAINKIYSKEGQYKIKAIAKEKKLNPFIVINIDKKLKTFFIFLKDKSKPHNYLI